METRQQQRFDSLSVWSNDYPTIEGVENLEFVDFSDKGFSFSTSAKLDVGEQVRLRLDIEDQGDLILFGLICSRRLGEEGTSRYGVFLDADRNLPKSMMHYFDWVIGPVMDNGAIRGAVQLRLV